jgi:hypothetical protein
MEIIARTLDLFRPRTNRAPATVEEGDYRALMEDALRRIRLSELQIKEATTVEDLDIGRSTLLQAWAEVQQLVRTAKRDRGISVRPVAETEEMHRKLRDFMNHRLEGERTASS